jgi:hypothetical protein
VTGKPKTIRVTDRLRAAWKFFLSLFKSDWEFSDYPVVMREHEIDPSYAGTRLKQQRHTASIVNWWVVTGGGDTAGEASRELEKAFVRLRDERAKAKQRLPRPGTYVPIEFGSQQRVGAYPQLADDFVRRVLDLDWAWISDASSLWDFHHSETNEALIARIKQVYGVDVSDIESANLSEILERIAAKQSSA